MNISDDPEIRRLNSMVRNVWQVLLFGLALAVLLVGQAYYIATMPPSKVPNDPKPFMDRLEEP